MQNFLLRINRDLDVDVLLKIIKIEVAVVEISVCFSYFSLAVVPVCF